MKKVLIVLLVAIMFIAQFVVPPVAASDNKMPWDKPYGLLSMVPENTPIKPGDMVKLVGDFYSPYEVQFVVLQYTATMASRSDVVCPLTDLPTGAVSAPLTKHAHFLYYVTILPMTFSGEQPHQVTCNLSTKFYINGHPELLYEATGSYTVSLSPFRLYLPIINR